MRKAPSVDIIIIIIIIIISRQYFIAAVRLGLLYAIATLLSSRACRSETAAVPSFAMTSRAHVPGLVTGEPAVVMHARIHYFAWQQAAIAKSA